MVIRPWNIQVKLHRWRMLHCTVDCVLNVTIGIHVSQVIQHRIQIRTTYDVIGDIKQEHN